MLDPINYDVAELRALAAETDTAARIEASGFRWVTPPPTAPERAHDEPLLSPEQRRRLLLLHGVSFDPTDSTPVLSTLPPDSTVLVFTWLEYLIAIGGTSGAHTALALYHNTDWLTGSVLETLHEYLAWIAPREGNGLAALDQSNHLLSFAYIAALAARQRTD